MISTNYKNQWMLAAILSCGLTITSCDDVLNVIDNLKEMPAVEFPKAFKNRWDEVRMIALDTVAMNRMKRRT